jgi:hypothetical protein
MRRTYTGGIALGLAALAVLAVPAAAGAKPLEHGPDGLAYGGEQLRGTDTFTLPNGHTFVVTFSFASKDLRVTDNGDGTLTILGQAAGNFVASGSHSSVVLRSTGIQRAEVLIDHAGTPTDPSDDEFLRFLGVIKEQTGRNDFGDFCEDLLLIAG